MNLIFIDKNSINATNIIQALLWSYDINCINFSFKFHYDYYLCSAFESVNSKDE